LGEVETVGRLLRERRWDEALRTYEDFSRRRDLAWGDPEVQGRLREIWQGEAPEELKNYSRCKEQYTSPGKARMSAFASLIFKIAARCKRRGKAGAGKMSAPAAETRNWWEGMEVKKVVEALFWASQNLGPAEYDQATEMMVSLLSSEVPAKGTSQARQSAEELSPEATPAGGASQSNQPAAKLSPEASTGGVPQPDQSGEKPTPLLVADEAARALCGLGEGVRRWLWDARFEPLEKFGEWPNFVALRDLRAKPRPRPSLWRGPRPAEREEVWKVLDAWGLARNPFGPEWAEGDPALPDLAYHPSWWEGVKQPEPALIVGAPGSGKTATALLLAHDWMNETSSQIFPVYASLSLTVPLTVETAGQKFSRLLGQALLEYLALDPEAFREAELPEQASAARLLMLTLGPKDRLAAAFAQAGLSCAQGIGSVLLEEISDLATVRPEIPDLFALLGRARPAGREATVFLLDPSLEAKPKELAGRLQPLLDLALPLARLGVYLKVFLSPDPARRARWEGKTFRIAWGEEDLEEMLKTRLQRSGRASSLNAEASQKLREKVGDVDQWLVRKARGSPRELVRLGNRLLEAVGRHSEDPRILPGDLAMVEGRSEEEEG